MAADGKLEDSLVSDEGKYGGVRNDQRTSKGMLLGIGQDETVARIEDRIATWSLIPKDNGEAMQILRYEHGQKYLPHHDFFGNGGQDFLNGERVATVLMYLSDVEKGGETVFPLSEAMYVQPKDDGSWSDCAKRGYAVKPKKGDAILFFSLQPDASLDTSSLHGSCPVISGVKWSATKWIHEEDDLQAICATGVAVQLFGEFHHSKLWFLYKHPKESNLARFC
ncbi:probable prolyl 4-hydroxylase 7 [Amborella trichopoda]|uniref:probable prolyl 4-hydroxylase 7 n=1 Tax=Amborella trichopoda TaxID=13333 RepID=UPI0009C067E7|nr:probable prolyl 4-hydroxylase 7 [Amborella trichopoda]|eukprot:XP_020528807.1 probable prolyl 4-hydroxylase 7 [Amborella trichopoda]